MYSLREIRKLRYVYLVLLLLVGFKVCLLLAPRFGVGYGIAYSDGNKTFPRIRDVLMENQSGVKVSGMDFSVFLELMVWEIYPELLEIFCKLSIDPASIFGWAVTHWLLSSMYFFIRAITKDKEAITSWLAVHLQLMSMLVVFAIFVRSRVILCEKQRRVNNRASEEVGMEAFV
ncbi:unnamed protein product [Orchesella dallaii]|uniref:Transmembrane protein n=1 Tax=Orchesella dallaii TaxID=48710 RepID=A0ABP1RVJ2_9HEXA